MEQKDIKKIVGYCVPIVVLVIATILGIEDTTALTGYVTALGAGVAGAVGIVGVIKTNRKKVDTDGK